MSYYNSNHSYATMNIIKNITDTLNQQHIMCAYMFL